MSLKTIREILEQHGRLPVGVDTLKDDSDLYNAGLTSLATVGLMLALEDTFDIEFPETMLSRKTFESIQAISDAVEELKN
jgi:acyl carrier protein